MMSNPKVALTVLVLYLFFGTIIVAKFICPYYDAADSVSAIDTPAVNEVASTATENLNNVQEEIPTQDLTTENHEDLAQTDIVIDEQENLEIAIPKQEQIIPQTNKTIVVQSGDCLSVLAAKHYGSGTMFQKIFEANRNLLSSPHLIYPGQVLQLP